MIAVRGLFIALMAICVLLPVPEAAAAVSMADLQRQAQQMRDREAKIWRERDAEQRQELQKQEAAAKEAVARRARAEARSKALDGEWNQNDKRIGEMQELLRQYQGNLGELFGVTRQVAGDAAQVLNQSMLSMQFRPAEGEESREDFMRRIAAAKELPSFLELNRMWFELQREMTENGKVVRFTAPVRPTGGETALAEVVRVGPYIASSNGEYLDYDMVTKTFNVLQRQLSGKRMAMAKRLQGASSGHVPAIVDPARGALLTLVADRPNWVERVKSGEVVGYVIILVGIIGVIVSLIQYAYLIVTRTSVQAQLRNLQQPSKGNPLGRVLLAFRDDRTPIASAEVAEVRVSEAVGREMPRLLRFQSFLRLCIAAGPLLGLVGTVVGMIITFHAIVASGTSDPKLMAWGIGQAMIATVLGLGIAIPLLFLNFGLTALSNGVAQILDEQSQQLLAEELKNHS